MIAIGYLEGCDVMKFTHTLLAGQKGVLKLTNNLLNTPLPNLLMALRCPADSVGLNYTKLFLSTPKGKLDITFLAWYLLLVV